MTQKFKDESTSEIPRDGFFLLFAWHLGKSDIRNNCIQKTKMSRSINDFFHQWNSKNGYNSQFDWQATYWFG